MASHQTAAFLWGLLDKPRQIDLLVGVGCGVRERSLRVHRTRRWDPRDLAVRAGIPATTLPRTLIDLASDADDETLELALNAALRWRHLAPGWLRKRLAVLQPGRKGTARLAHFLSTRDRNDTLEEQSHLESRVKLFLHRRGFPTPVLQLPISEGDRHLGVFDFAYPRKKVVLEVDGYRHHSDRFAWSRDRRRTADLASAGWRVVPITAADFDEPDRLEATLRGALGLPPRRR